MTEPGCARRPDVPGAARVSVVAFVLTRLSGDWPSLMLPPEATQQERQAFRSAYGLDDPLPASTRLCRPGAG